MAEPDRFASFMRRIRAGDARAAEELVRCYEKEIRREIRLRLRDPRLSRAFDSMDVCQSVLGSFFVHIALGQYELTNPRQLFKLLMSMARRKLAFRVRKERAQRRDYRRLEVLAADHPALAARGTNPSDLVAGAEMLHEIRQRLSPEERRLAELKAGGQSWNAIAAQVGGTAGARRKQLGRAIDRITAELFHDDPTG